MQYQQNQYMVNAYPNQVTQAMLTSLLAQQRLRHGPYTGFAYGA
jgi:hypothetical protein